MALVSAWLCQVSSLAMLMENLPGGEKPWRNGSRVGGRCATWIIKKWSRGGCRKIACRVSWRCAVKLPVHPWMTSMTCNRWGLWKKADPSRLMGWSFVVWTRVTDTVCLGAERSFIPAAIGLHNDTLEWCLLFGFCCHIYLFCLMSVYYCRLWIKLPSGENRDLEICDLCSQFQRCIQTPAHCLVYIVEHCTLHWNHYVEL